MRINPKPEREINWDYIRYDAASMAGYHTGSSEWSQKVITQAKEDANTILRHSKILYETLLAGEIPDFDPINECSLRKLVNSFRMWAYISKQFAQALAKAMEATFGPNATYLEIMAGTGWLAKALIEADLKGIYIATDLNPPDDAVFPVSKIDAVKAIINHRNNIDAFVVSWPPYQDAIIEKCLDVMPPGAKLIYIGEDYGGCTATYDFFKRIRSAFESITSPEHQLWLDADKKLFVWGGMSDYLDLKIKRP